MTTNEPLTYVVVITLSLPGEDAETSLRLELGPADVLVVEGGATKLLQDCTLAELQQFADTLEAKVWDEFLDATLVDLVVDDRLQIDVTFDQQQEDALPAGELLLDHVVIFSPPPATAEAGERPAKEQEQAPEPVDPGDSAVESEEEVTTVGVQISEPIVEQATSPEGETQAVAETEAEAEEAEPLVTVADSEPVHEEREAPAEIEAPDLEQLVARPRTRILGRRRPLGHSTRSAVDILINEKAFRDAQAHAISSPDREVAGVMVGPPPEKQPDGRYIVHISDMIIAKHTRMHGASVTYTPESWRYVNDRLAALFPDETAVIVGWYHTHPGFGIFLSGMDQFIHHNFFTQIWHVALVLDPIARRSGFFSWDRPKSQVESYDFPWPIWASDSW